MIYRDLHICEAALRAHGVSGDLLRSTMTRLHAIVVEQTVVMGRAKRRKGARQMNLALKRFMALDREITLLMEEAMAEAHADTMHRAALRRYSGKDKQ